MLLVIVGICSVQFGAALAKGLFDEVGVAGAVFLRVLFAAIALMLVFRPSLRMPSRRALPLLVTFGIVLAAMNLSFYASLERIPLGVAVTLEFVGPLGVAVAGSRSAVDLVWVGLAALGIVLLSDFGSGGLDLVGAGLALMAGGFWAAYILLSARVGRVFQGGDGLALAMVVGAVVLTPVGVARGGAELAEPAVLAVAMGVALLSSAIPYGLEMEALRRMPTRVFGTLMSLEPAAGVLAGFVVLGEDLSAREIVAILLVAAASAGASRGASVAPRDA